jgi:hypothetical protein
MQVVPTDSNPFKWSEIHSLAKAKLEALDQTIREEIQAHLEALPANGGARHQFFVLLSERVDDWATRAKTAYQDCLTQIGREPSQSINHSIWENGMKFFISENLRRYMILACGITAQELKWAEEGSAGVRSTPQVKAVLSTLNDINRIIQSVRDRFQFTMNRSDDWLADTQKLLASIKGAHPEDLEFVSGRPPISPVKDRGLEHAPLQVSAETDVASKESIPSQTATDAPWQQLSTDFSKLASEEKSANARPLNVMCMAESNRLNDLADWKISDGSSENSRARFELLASQAGKALDPLPMGASPFCYWLHRLYQNLRENRSRLSSRFITDSSSSMEVPFIDCVCEASSTFCLRLQKAMLDREQKGSLATYFQDWIENNSVNVSIPPQVSGRNRVSIVAENARTPIPIHFLSSRLQEIDLPRGSTEFGSPSKLLDQIADAHGLIWVITQHGLWMAQQPPSAGLYIDAHGIQHQEQTPQAAPPSQSDPAIRSDVQSDNRISTNRERIDKFIDRIMRERGTKINKTDINRVAGYKDRSQFEEWQSGKLKPGSTPDVNFNRVLSLSADEFLQRLQTVKTSSSRKLSN